MLRPVFLIYMQSSRSIILKSLLHYALLGAEGVAGTSSDGVSLGTSSLNHVPDDMSNEPFTNDTLVCVLLNKLDMSWELLFRTELISVYRLKYISI